MKFAIWMGLALAVCLDAQDVAMGARRGSGARLESPYTLEIETPHVKWAKPLPGGPIHLLAVPTVSEGRTLVELAQRLSLDLTTVSIDAAFDVNKWTMCFGRDYGARAERGDFSLIYGYLEQELTGPKHFDAILLQTSHGWERLTPRAREALVRRVREGAGLVWVRPFESELSPLAPEQPVAPPSAAYAMLEPGRTEASPWRRAGEHYITRPIPVETFPFAYLENYLYRAAPGATVLVSSGSGHPVAAVRDFGKGRVVALGYRNAGLSWRMPMTARGFVPDQPWEAFYALLCRAVIWSAQREKDAAGEWRVPVAAPVRREVEDLKASSAIIREGDAVEVTWRAPKPQTVDLVDGFGRAIARAQGTNRATLNAGRPLTHSGFVVAGTEKIPVRFAAATREWTDYEVIMPWYGPPTYQPWMTALDEQYRKAGITTLANPERDFKLIASAGLHDTFGVYAYRNANYVKRKASYAETKDKKYLTRDVVLQAPGFEDQLRADLKTRLDRLAPLKPLAYYLADESSLTTYTDAFDVDWAPAALAGLRVWLRGEYKTIGALNASWGTTFRDWDAVVPMTTEEAQQHGNYAPWADHRIYMERDFVRALAAARRMVGEIDPGAPASISGTQVPTAHNGADWYAIDQIMDYLQPYSGGNQDAMHHLFRPGMLLTGFTGYGTTGAALHHQQWQRLFYGHTGASI
ncbi:MAG: beta-galactosidase, partial [Acidobacteria bacterium]|nr:beta-galactosidase [Acidobacteriota bacterium]